MEEIIKEIKKKKELSDLPDDLVFRVLNSYLKRNNFKIPKNPGLKKIIIKEIRSELRRYTGQYQSKSAKKREKLFEQDNIKEILKTHSSTKERFESYHKLKEIIYRFNPNSILDLGCGLNPLALASPSIFYYAYDIKESELNLIKEYFKKNNLQGKIVQEDITKVKEFPKTDLCLIFKVLDILESKKTAKDIIKKIKSRIIIASFATRTLSGKLMKQTRRVWFESFLKEFNLNFEIVNFSNEIFYIIRKA